MKRVVITGAAAGIGRALAFEFANQGAEIVGIDCDEAGLHQLCSELEARNQSFTPAVVDLGASESILAAVEEIAALGPIHGLINNAGISAAGRFEQLPLADQLAVIRVNLTAPLLLTSGLLARNAIASGGTIVFVSSLSHFVGYPGAAVYAATKDGLVSYARSLRAAAAKRGINVLTVYPGPTRTAHARRYSPDNRREHRRMLPEELAALICKAVDGRQSVLIPGWKNRLFATLGKWLPSVTERAIHLAGGVPPLAPRE